MSSWLNRTTKQYVPRSSPRDMEATYGGSFVDAEGNAQANADWIYQPDLSAVVGFAPKYWTIIGDVVLLKSQAERDAIDLADIEASRDALVNELDQVEDILRAFALALLDEFNLHASRTTAILDAIDGASNLAGVKTAVASILDVPQRSISDLKTAIRNKLGT